MIQYLNLPIYILYSEHSQESTWSQTDAIRGDIFYGLSYLKNEKKISDLTRTNQLTDDKSNYLYRQEAARYESYIKSQLDLIRSTHIGQMLFAQFNPNIKTYIIPDPNIPFFLNKKKRYYGYAITSKEKDERGVETARIHINADGDTSRFDELLFHELVHAARYANRINAPKEIPTHPYGFMSSEEFIASQMSNIYRSSLGKQEFFLYYLEKVGESYPKDNAYSLLLGSQEMMQTLKHFLDYDSFTRQVALYVNTDFNPFRDYDSLPQYY